MDNKGYAMIGIIEIILILAVLIGLVVLFKGEVQGIIENAFDAITEGADKIIE